MKGFRTFAVAAAVAVLGAFQTLDFTQLFDAKTAGVVIIALGGLMAVLRAVTTTPPASADPVAVTPAAPAANTEGKA